MQSSCFRTHACRAQGRGCQRNAGLTRPIDDGQCTLDDGSQQSPVDLTVTGAEEGGSQHIRAQPLHSSVCHVSDVKTASSAIQHAAATGRLHAGQHAHARYTANVNSFYHDHLAGPSWVVGSSSSSHACRICPAVLNTGGVGQCLCHT